MTHVIDYSVCVLIHVRVARQKRVVVKECGGACIAADPRHRGRVPEALAIVERALTGAHRHRVL